MPICTRFHTLPSTKQNAVERPFLLMGIDPYVPFPYLFPTLLICYVATPFQYPILSLSLSLSLSQEKAHSLPWLYTMSCCKSCRPKTRVSAAILDLDGTLLDTETSRTEILKELLGRYGKEMDEEKENKQRLGMTQKESAAGIVEDYDLPLTPDQFIQEITPMHQEKWQHAKPLPGANRLIKHLHKHGVPFALASNSLRENIDTKISHQRGWKVYFSVILGSDEVKAGKPAPYLFEEASKRMGVDAAQCLVIEDSLVGVRAAKAAQMKVVAIPPHTEPGCSSLADSVLRSLLEFQPEVWGLPPFEDWVDNALPIEPIHVNGVYFSETACEVSEDAISTLPDQVCGLFFGWARVDTMDSFKIVVGIGWDPCSCIAKRKFHICIIDGSNDLLSDQHLQLQLVGYLRSNSKDSTPMDGEALEEYKSIASASLDQPMFAHDDYEPLFPEASSASDSFGSDEKEE